MNKTTAAKKPSAPLCALDRYNAAVSEIKWAEAAGRSYSTMQRLYRKMFAAEDAIKATNNPWM